LPVPQLPAEPAGQFGGNGIVTGAVTVNSGGFGVAATAGDQFYKMGPASTLPVGSATANYQGMALFVGNKGRPVRATLNGTSTNTVNSLTAAYE